MIIAIIGFGTTAFALQKYERTIPKGYSGKTVLKVSYGKSFGTVGVSWGDTGTVQEGVEPASVQQMHVVGDRFYFYDATDSRIKQFIPPGKCIWESSRFPNVLGYTISPGGLVYIVWGDSLNTLSCIDGQGHTLWTKKEREILPQESYQAYGFEEIEPAWSNIEWTHYGLTIRICVSPEGGGLKYLTFAFTDDGRIDRLLTDDRCSIGPDGSFYCRESLWKGDQSEKQATVKDKAGKKVGQVDFEFIAENGRYLAAKEMSIGRLRSHQSRDFFVEGYAFMDQEYEENSVVKRSLEEVLWRFDSQGKFKEQWRFLSPPFRHLGIGIVPGSDGSIYHLQFGETGIEVVKYSKG